MSEEQSEDRAHDCKCSRDRRPEPLRQTIGQHSVNFVRFVFDRQFVLLKVLFDTDEVQLDLSTRHVLAELVEDSFHVRLRHHFRDRLINLLREICLVTQNGLQ